MRSLQTALLLLVSGLIVTGLVTISIKADLKAVAKQEFDFASNQITQKVKERFNTHAQILYSGAAFFAASENVSRQKWQAFVQNLSLESQFPCIRGLGYAAIIIWSVHRFVTIRKIPYDGIDQKMACASRF